MTRQFLMIGLLAGLMMALLFSAAYCRAARSRFLAINTPAFCEVNKGHRKHVRAYRYVYYYRTEVRNNSKTPLRVISFRCLERVNGHWVEVPNIMKRPLVTQDFVKWYNDGDPIPDGWIAPGKTAACDPNWSAVAQPLQVRRQMKWEFSAEDNHGKRFAFEAKIELLPVSSQRLQP